MNTAEAFKALGFKHPTNDFEAVRAAYRRSCFETHPDHGGDAADFRAVRQAWLALDTPGKVGAAFDAFYGFEPVDAETARRVAYGAPDPAFSPPPRPRGMAAEEHAFYAIFGHPRDWAPEDYWTAENLPEGARLIKTVEVTDAASTTFGIWKHNGVIKPGPSPSALRAMRPRHRWHDHRDDGKPEGVGHAFHKVGPWDIPNGSRCLRPMFGIRIGDFTLPIPIIWQTPDGRSVEGPAPEDVLDVRPDFTYTEVHLVPKS